MILKAAWLAMLVVLMLRVVDALLGPSHPPHQGWWLADRGGSPPPPAAAEFCDREPSQCAIVPGAVPHDFMEELERVNTAVNEQIIGRPDRKIYGVADYWTIPAIFGDCEDFALLKRQRLIAAGWPSDALLMTVVDNDRDEYHAVLTVVTWMGDLILDSLNDDVLTWEKTGYRFIKRQSRFNPKEWVSLSNEETQR